MISQLSQDAWDKKVIELGGSILQSWVWGEFQKALGLKINRFSTEEFVNLAVELPLPMGKKYLYSPKGPVGNAEDALLDISKFGEIDRDLVFARLEPSQVINLPKAAKEIQPSHTWILELKKNEEELLMHMKPKHRYNINLASRRGVTIRQGGKEDLLVFWKLLLETAGRGKFSLHPQNYYWQLWETLPEENRMLLVASYKGKPLTAMIITMFGDTVVFLHGGSTSSNKDVMAPFLLHWEAMKIAKKLGYKNYDFGGISNNPNHSWAGITRFKKGFGGFEVSYPGTYDMVFSPFWYQAYKHARAFRQVFSRS